jgi:hypothetical protein
MKNKRPFQNYLKGPLRYLGNTNKGIVYVELLLRINV